MSDGGVRSGGAGVDEVLARAVAAYECRFGERPSAAGCAPGRVNLIGDHTDYTGGLALPMAIDRWCVAVGGMAGDARRTTLVAADLGTEVELDLSVPMEGNIEALPNGDWARYAAGVVAEFGAAGREAPAVRIAVASTVPIGAGLSSSAALEVAVATLLEGLRGVSLGPMEKALLCQRAEHRWAGVRCGLMDQLASVAGREGHALLMDFAVPSVTPVALPENLVFLVADTRVKRRLAAGRYDLLVRSCEAAGRALGLRSLGEARPALVREQAGLLGELYPFARHVADENSRVRAAAEALGSGDLDRFGLLMLESHHSLMEYGVSCEELDSLVDILTGMTESTLEPGVFGARMTGAGFGGCIVAAVAPWAVPRAIERLRDGYMHRHGRECDVFLIRASGGARVLAV